jgi:hypothetical protein
MAARHPRPRTFGQATGARIGRGDAAVLAIATGQRGIGVDRRQRRR